MSGIAGWYGGHVPGPSLVLDAMAARVAPVPGHARVSVAGDGFALTACGDPETIAAADTHDVKLVLQGHPRRGAARLALDALARELADAYREQGAGIVEGLQGDFAIAIVDNRRRELALAVDRMGVRNVAWQQTHDALAFASSLDALFQHPAVEHRVSPQALHDFLYFHVLPGPGTVFERSQRLLPGHRLVAHGGSIEIVPYWTMTFAPRSVDFASRARAFREALAEGVEAYALAERCGAFLSGGTDSTTVTGMLAARSDRPVPAFSIGFRADGYDEMEYARIAARRFGADHHEYYVTPEDVERAVPIVIDGFDQPFGNASALPAYFCAELARETGIRRLLAGDGGDELFGGNSRYALQQQFDLYRHVPRAFREALLEPMLAAPLAQRVPLLRKGAGYVRQAKLPMPARYESYNLVERLGRDAVFEPEFLASIDTGQPLAQLTAWWNRAPADSLINGMLALDLKFTLADSDLPKVVRACDAAGVDVAFPLLHESVVDFSATLSPRDKLAGGRLRPFFKAALADLLPAEIVAKKKHGFGLPIGPWLASHPPLHERMREATSALARRGIVRKEFIEALVERRLAEHAGYYGTLAWLFVVLELWLERHERESAARAARAA